jgi:hypothetical protein
MGKRVVASDSEGIEVNKINFVILRNEGSTRR